MEKTFIPHSDINSISLSKFRKQQTTMTDLLSDHLGNIIIETADYANYDERLSLLVSLEEDPPMYELESYSIAFNLLFRHPAFELPNGDYNETRYLEMLEHLQYALPRHSLDVIDGAQHRPQKYDDLGHPARY
jgi:hypothetical protein